MRIASLVLVLLLTACSAGSEQETPDIEGLQVFEVEPENRHSTERQTYERTPPAGGVHWPASAEGVRGWLRCGVYDEPVPNEFAVHSQEHGAVWLTYQPGLDAGPLKQLAQGNDYVLVSPYEGQPGKYTASTWGAQLSVDTATDGRLKEFVDAYAGGGQGGEKGADCAKAGALPGDARRALDKAND